MIINSDLTVLNHNFNIIKIIDDGDVGDIQRKIVSRNLVQQPLRRRQRLARKLSLLIAS